MTHWTEQQKHLLVYWKEECEYTYEFIAELFKREFGFITTKNACIGKHRYLRENGFVLLRRLIADYLPSPFDPPLDHDVQL